MKLFAFIFSCCLLTLIAHADVPPPTPSSVPVIAPDEKAFKGEAQAGSVVVSGNTKSESYTGAAKLSFKPDDNLYLVEGRYLRTTAGGVESALNWEAGARYERSLSGWFSLYAGYKSEGDYYSGFVQRDSPEVGAKYFLTKTETLTWTTEAGYRYSTTNFVATNKAYDSFGRLYTEYNQVLSQTVTLKYWVEYLPNLTQEKAYLANSEASVNVMLSKILSLKIGYLVQYQNVAPPAGQHTDTTSTMNLVAKF